MGQLARIVTVMARKEAVYVRVDAADKALLRRVEATLGRETTLSAWIRSVIRVAAEKRMKELDSVRQGG